MFVKICGTTNLADAELAVELGADALGFIFAPSKRRVTVEQAAAITSRLPSSVERVGIFTEPDAAEIIRTVREAHLTAVQMNLPRDEALIEQLSAAFQGDVKLWQVLGFEIQAAVAPQPEEFERSALAAFLDARLTAVLVDTAKHGASGGLGESFPWRQAAPLLASAREKASQPPGRYGVEPAKLIIAGGLHAGNVGDAMITLSPWGVDVVSGVEASPGCKSPVKLAAFLLAARGSLPCPS